MMETTAEPASQGANSLTRPFTRRRFTWLAQAAAACLFLLSVAAVAEIWRLALTRAGAEGQWMLVQAPLFICATALAWRFAAGHERRWIVPTRKLARLIDEARAGELSIEALAEVEGPLAEAAAAVRHVLIELRREKQNSARLHAEIQQRIRSRTDALERRVSSWQTQACRDPLTSLCNRRQLEEQLPRIIEQCQIDSIPLCVLAVDLDNFKHVNDSLGHDAGDRFLRDVGQLMRSAVREGDWAFRLGGDEFLILIPGHDWPAGKKLARRLTALVDQLARTIPVRPSPGLSIGIVCPNNLHGLNAVDLLKLADAAMYQEKTARKAGR
jgi:diguanylate cyclase (GGDEF)-like protein